MADFYQNGAIATLHQIGEIDLSRLEEHLVKHSAQRPISLILLGGQFDGQDDALPHIVDELVSVGYLNRIVLTIEDSDPTGSEQARNLLALLPQATAAVWCGGSRLAELLKRLDAEGLAPPLAAGRTRSLWLSLGYLLACRDSAVIAVHDTDILSYERALLARLVYPLVDPNMEYEFAKGYYARVSDRLHGRVARLFVTPLLRALRKVCGRLDLLDYLDSFRYPLAGEYALTSALAAASALPIGGGLELGLLGEIHAGCAERRICQVDLSIDYEHRHEELSASDPNSGLLKMSIDIAAAVFDTLAAEGVILSDALFRSLELAYRRLALDTVRHFEDDSAINGLIYERNAELRAIEAFSQGLKLAVERFSCKTHKTALLPSWSRVVAARPNILNELRAAVEADNGR